MTDHGNEKYWRDLGERWLKAGGRMREGMIDMEGNVAIDDCGIPLITDGNVWWDHGGNIELERITGQNVPDFRRASSMGCLLKDVREAWGDDGLTAQDRRKGAQGWWVWLSDPTKADVLVRGAPTEAEALVAAREAAPDSPPSE